MKYLILCSLFVIAACAHSPKIDPANSRVEKSGVSIGANWIKNKGDKFDLQFSISNQSGKNIILMLNEISCARGGTVGQLRHTFFNTGERTIDLRIGQMKSMNMVCKIGFKARGDYKISIAKIYDNPVADGATKGKVITENMVWTAPEN